MDLGKMDTIVRSSSAIWNISVNLKDSHRGSHLLLLILESHYLIADSLLCFPSAPCTALAGPVSRCLLLSTAQHPIEDPKGLELCLYLHTPQ